MKPMKIIMIGPSGIGKTTFRKIFFDQESPLKLLSQTLEPTYGIESTIYDIGFTIAIHDLAGQQIEEWLTISTEIFEDSDIIFCLLDSRDDILVNLNIYYQIKDICFKCCPDAKIVIFLHKADLLDESKRNSLQNYIDHEFPIQPNTYIYITSITEDFFLDLYRVFLQILNNTSYGMQQLRIVDMIKAMTIISWFSNHKTLTHEELTNQLKIPENSIDNILDSLKSQGLINIESNTGTMVLNNSGYDILSKIKERIRITLEDKPDELQIIQAVLIADQYGRTLIVVEREKDFFKKAMVDPEATSDPDLISMFFCAIRNFGTTFNKTGFSTIHIESTGFQLITINYESIFAIFFLDEKNSNLKMIEYLRKFVIDFLNEYENALDYFGKTGSLIRFDTNKEKIISKIKQLNVELMNIGQCKVKISRDNLFKFYVKIDRLKISLAEKKRLKDTMMKYFVVEDNQILNEFYAILQKLNLTNLLS